VDRVAEYVDAELATELTLNRLAAVAMLSPYHFARAFKATTGLPPHQFVTARRMDRAKSLLLDQRHAVPEVAYAVGLSNIGHFRRVFRRHLGLNPGELRRTARMDPPCRTERTTMAPISPGVTCTATPPVMPAGS